MYNIVEVITMKLDLTGLRIEVTDAYREFTEKKIKKLEKFFI